MFEKLKSHFATYKLELIVFILSFGWFAFHWMANYPAMYTWDFLHYLNLIVKEGRLPGNLSWESFLYEIYVYWTVKLSVQQEFTSLFQIILYSCLTANFANLIFRHLNLGKLGFIFLGAFLLAPPIFYLPLLTERDTLAVLFGSLGLIKLSKILIDQKNHVSSIDYLKLFTMFGVMAAFRKDAVPLLIVFPFVIFLNKKEKRYINLFRSLILITLLVSAYVLKFESRYAARFSELQERYNLNASIFSFSYILVNMSEPLEIKDAEILRKVIDLEELKKQDILSPKTKQLWNWSGYGKNSQEFNRLIYKTLLLHPGLFVKSRIEMFKANTETSMIIFRLTPHTFANQNFLQFKEVGEDYQLETKVVFAQLNFMKEFHRLIKDKSLYFHWITQPVLIVIILFIFLMSSPWTPLTRSLMLVPWLHCLTVFFFQPFPNSKYYLFTYVSVFLLLPVFTKEAIKLRIGSDKLKI